MDKAASLVADLLAFIAQDACTDDQFDQLALRQFAYRYDQYAVSQLLPATRCPLLCQDLERYSGRAH